MSIYISNINNLIANYDEGYKYSSLTINRLKKTKVLKRIKEIKAIELLFKQVYKDFDYLTLSRTKNGKPYFNEINEKFSYAHSYEYICLYTSNTEVGIDIQKISPQAKKVSRMYLLENEAKLATTDLEFTIFWTLKEVVIKRFDLNLTKLAEIKILSIQKDGDEFLSKCTYQNRMLNIRSKIYDGFVISYSANKPIPLKFI